MSVQSVIQKHKTLLYIVLTIAIIVLATVFVVRERMQSLELSSRLQIAEQQALLSTIAETTARNGADSVTEAIVRDCPLADRSRFDSLLGRLDAGLSRTELLELDQLFTACGHFHAERKALMVSRLSREIEIYETYVTLLSEVTGQDQAKVHRQADWVELATLEQTQSTLFTDLVAAQKRIINALLEGKSATSDEVVVILRDVQEIREALLLAKQQSTALRGELSAL